LTGKGAKEEGGPEDNKEGKMRNRLRIMDEVGYKKVDGFGRERFSGLERRARRTE
jgi:hypothetical protein